MVKNWKKKVFEAKECSKTYTALERGIGCIYKGMRISKESIGNLIEHSNTIVFLEEGRNAAIEAFISREKRRADFAKEISTVRRKTLCILKN